MNYKLSTNISAQNVGPDSVILNLNTGKYFNLKGFSSELFNHYARGGSLEDAASATSSRFGKSLDDVKQELATFTDSLVRQDIVSESNSVQSVTFDPQIAAYQTPTFEIFDDLQDQLLLDAYIEDPISR